MQITARVRELSYSIATMGARAEAGDPAAIVGCRYLVGSLLIAGMLFRW